MVIKHEEKKENINLPPSKQQIQANWDVIYLGAFRNTYVFKLFSGQIH